MDKRKLPVIRLILKILRFAVIIGFIALTAMTLRNGQEFGSMPLSGIILIRAAVALILFAVLLVPELRIRKKLRSSEPAAEKSGPEKKHTGLKAAAAVIFVIAAAVLLVWFGQDYALFIPRRGEGIEQILEEDPECSREVFGSGGDTYVGWLWSPKDSDGSVVVYFGGNAQFSALAIRSWCMDNAADMFGGHKVLCVDYPGYGESPGRPGEKAIFRMVDTVMPQIILSYDRVYLMGFSLGTGTATYAAANYDTEALILIAPYDNMTNVYNDNLNIFHGPLKALIHNRFESDVYAHSVAEPVLIIASEDDEVISCRHSRRLGECFDRAGFITVKNAGHNDIPDLEETKDAIRKFLGRGTVK